MIIGYTTGVFDLFHIGHLNILKNAKNNCDYLIVGVTTDELSFSRKKKYPVIPYSERVEIIASIKYVDKVVPQDNMNKIDAFHQYGFNIVFVGSDWKGHETWNKLESEFNGIGVQVQYFDYTKNTSSTLLRAVLEKI
jgi:glycerol-3-phosphate cytidylyltransferase